MFRKNINPCLSHCNVAHDLPLPRLQRGLRPGRLLGLLEFVIRTSGGDCRLLCRPGPDLPLGGNFLHHTPGLSEAAGGPSFLTVLPSCQVDVLNVPNRRRTNVVRRHVQDLGAATGEETVTLRFGWLD